jgi:hypothetical protein
LKLGDDEMEKAAYWWEPVVEKSNKVEKEQKVLMQELVATKQTSKAMMKEIVDTKQTLIDLSKKFELLFQLFVNRSDDNEKAIFRSLGLL